jgi:hypothetical protein
MKTLEIFKTRKTEIVNATLEVIADAICGNGGMFTSSVAFFVKEVDETIEVDSYRFTGQQYHSENVFYIIYSSEIQNYNDTEPDSIDVSEFEFYIEEAIDRHIADLETIEE